LSICNFPFFSIVIKPFDGDVPLIVKVEFEIIRDPPVFTVILMPEKFYFESIINSSEVISQSLSEFDDDLSSASV